MYKCATLQVSTALQLESYFLAASSGSICQKTALMGLKMYGGVEVQLHAFLT